MENNQTTAIANVQNFRQTAACPECHGSRQVEMLPPGMSINDPRGGEFELCGYCGGTGTVPACPCGQAAAPDEYFCDEECADEYGCQVMVDIGEKCRKPITSIMAWGKHTERCCDDCVEHFRNLNFRRVA